MMHESGVTLRNFESDSLLPGILKMYGNSPGPENFQILQDLSTKILGEPISAEKLSAVVIQKYGLSDPQQETLQSLNQKLLNVVVKMSNAMVNNPTSAAFFILQHARQLRDYVDQVERAILNVNSNVTKTEPDSHEEPPPNSVSPPVVASQEPELPTPSQKSLRSCRRGSSLPPRSLSSVPINPRSRVISHDRTRTRTQTSSTISGRRPPLTELSGIPHHDFSESNDGKELYLTINGRSIRFALEKSRTTRYVCSACRKKGLHVRGFLKSGVLYTDDHDCLRNPVDVAPASTTPRTVRFVRDHSVAPDF